MVIGRDSWEVESDVAEQEDGEVGGTFEWEDETVGGTKVGKDVGM